jgi:hypothetical protein
MKMISFSEPLKVPLGLPDRWAEFRKKSLERHDKDPGFKPVELEPANMISRVNRAGGVTDEQRDSTRGDSWSGESDCPHETKYD